MTRMDRSSRMRQPGRTQPARPPNGSPRNASPRNVIRDKPLPGRTVSASRTEMMEMVLPQDANPVGYILGGRVMHLIDIAGAIATHRHCRSYAVTASVDSVDFINPVS